MVAKVSVHKSSVTDDLIATAVKDVVVTDAKGRAIKLSKPNALAQFRLVKMLGSSAENGPYVSMVLPLIFVAEVDGEAIPFPRSEAQLEALILRLDDEGLAAVVEGVTANWGAVNPEAEADEIKK